MPQNLLTLPPPRGAIEFRNVTMRYRPDAADALRNVTLSIAAGEVIGIVGPSGSGKSTLTKLIQRLYSPQMGQVMIDGVDVAQLDPGWLRRQIGVVLQENILFNRTIHENIALGDPAMPRVMVMQAARLAGADEFIAQLPQGYDTMIEERGREPFRRPAPAHRHRPRARDQSAHSDPRRGDLGARLRQRADHPGEHARDRARDAPSSSSPIGSRRSAPAPASSACSGARSSRSARMRSSCRREGGLYAHLWDLQSDQARTPA